MEASKIVALALFSLCLWKIHSISALSPPQPVSNQGTPQSQSPHHSNQPQPHSANSEQDSVGKSSEREVPYSHYNYRGGPVSNAGNSYNPNYAGKLFAHRSGIAFKRIIHQISPCIAFTNFVLSFHLQEATTLEMHTVPVETPLQTIHSWLCPAMPTSRFPHTSGKFSGESLQSP
jgi:hypothetical protein